MFHIYERVYSNFPKTLNIHSEKKINLKKMFYPFIVRLCTHKKYVSLIFYVYIFYVYVYNVFKIHQNRSRTLETDR